MSDPDLIEGDPKAFWDRAMQELRLMPHGPEMAAQIEQLQRALAASQVALREAQRGNGHPWSDFLKARARVIDWLYYRNPDMTTTFHSDAGIAATLSMDPTQVYLIRTRDEKPGDNLGQVAAIKASESPVSTEAGT